MEAINKWLLILGFHVTSAKTKIKNFEFSPSFRYKSFLHRYLLACLQLGGLLCFENRTPRFFTMRDMRDVRDIGIDPG